MSSDTLLDPVISAFLAESQARAAVLPPASSAAGRRTQLDALADQLFREVAEGMPPGVSIEDRVLTGIADGVPVRIYRPDAPGVLGVHVFVHGGGWWQGSAHDWLADAQAAERAASVPCIVVSVEYRLAPEHPFPAGLDDIAAVLRWTKTNASALGGDDSSVSVGGISAGANLVAGALLKLRDEGLPLPDFASFEVGVFDLDLYGPYDSLQRFGRGFGLETADLPGLIDMYLPDISRMRDPYASPLKARSLEGFPPSYFLTAEFDPSRSSSEAFADRLEREGVPVGRTLGRGHVHQSPVMTKVLPAAAEWRRDLLQALRQFHANAATR